MNPYTPPTEPGTPESQGPTAKSICKAAGWTLVGGMFLIGPFLGYHQIRGDLLAIAANVLFWGGVLLLLATNFMEG